MATTILSQRCQSGSDLLVPHTVPNATGRQAETATFGVEASIATASSKRSMNLTWGFVSPPMSLHDEVGVVKRGAKCMR